MSSSVISVQGREGVHEMLRDYTNPQLTKRLQAATKVAATVFKAPLQAEARKVSKRMGSDVKVLQARKDKPASIVKFGKKAWFDHFVIGGTRDHGPRSASALAFQGSSGFVVTKHVRGVRPNPMVDRVADRYERQSLDALERALAKSEST